MEAIKVVIVDDEAETRERLRALLSERRDVVLVGECEDADSALGLIAGTYPDLIFLRFDSQAFDGREIVNTPDVPDDCAVIFLTNCEQHLEHPFAVLAIDYLLCPFSDRRFEWALTQAKVHILHQRLTGYGRQVMDMFRKGPARLVASAGEDESRSTRYLERLAVPVGDSIRVYKVEDIDYFEGAGVYVKLHVNGKTELLRETLSFLEERLDPSQFVRIHRSTIVNLDRVRELKPYYHGQYMVCLTTGAELKVSRSRRERLDLLLGRA